MKIFRVKLTKFSDSTLKILCRFKRKLWFMKTRKTSLGFTAKNPKKSPRSWRVVPSLDFLFLQQTFCFSLFLNFYFLAIHNRWLPSSSSSSSCTYMHITNATKHWLFSAVTLKTLTEPLKIQMVCWIKINNI